MEWCGAIETIIVPVKIELKKKKTTDKNNTAQFHNLTNFIILVITLPI
jgi:hypothetical protein